MLTLMDTTDFSELTALSRELTSLKNHEENLLYEKKQELKEIEDRKTQLIEGLAKIGLKLRDRSIICEHYINDISKTEYTTNGVYQRKYELSEVIDECAKKHWLFSYTSFRKAYSKEALRKYYASDSIDSLKEARAIVFDSVREKFIKEHPYPDYWPWLKLITA